MKKTKLEKIALEELKPMDSLLKPVLIGVGNKKINIALVSKRTNCVERVLCFLVEFNIVRTMNVESNFITSFELERYEKLARLLTKLYKGEQKWKNHLKNSLLNKDIL